MEQTPESNRLTQPVKEPTTTASDSVPGLAPDGKPYETTQEIGDDNKIKFRVEWVKNTKRLIFENGQVYAESNYNDGKQEGVSQSWYDNGQPQNRSEWVKGLREGDSISYARTGAMLEKGSYKSNYRDGFWEEWYPSGRRKSSGSYESSPQSYQQLKTGQWTMWHDNGAIDESQSGTYQNGKLISH
jgi:antitoxin component YwqK of YwqJK toxin-antitoxin module